MPSEVRHMSSPDDAIRPLRSVRPLSVSTLQETARTEGRPGSPDDEADEFRLQLALRDVDTHLSRLSSP